MTDAASIAPTGAVSLPRQTVFDTGAEGCPQGVLPGAAVFSVDEAKHALNPLQHLPVIGMLYRQATGESVPPPLSILGSIAVGAAFGPVGIVGSIAVNFASELFRLGSDTSRPAVPEGMEAAGAEAGMQPVSPGSATQPGGYTTLATTLPDFLGGGAGTTQFAGPDAPPQVRTALNAYVGTMTGYG